MPPVISSLLGCRSRLETFCSQNPGLSEKIVEIATCLLTCQPRLTVSWLETHRTFWTRIYLVDDQANGVEANPILHCTSYTCSETSLRLLLWSASFVHKTIPTNWQERLVDSTRTSVRSMLSTSLLWGRFRCSRTIQIWSKVIPDCDNSAVKRKFKWTTWRFLGWASSHFWKNWQVRMADQAMYHQGNQSVFVGGRLWTLLPPPAK